MMKVTRRDALGAFLGVPAAMKGATEACPGVIKYPRWDIVAIQDYLRKPQTMPPQLPYVLIAAHRALWRDTPENSETAIRLAFSQWEMLETDLRKAKDSTEEVDLVVTHDPDIFRTTNAIGGLWNYSIEQLKKAFLLDRYGRKYPGGTCYPYNKQGMQQLDGGSTQIGQKMLTFRQLLSIQQDFLTGGDARPYGPIIVMDVKGAVAADPDFNLPGRGVYRTINLALDVMNDMKSSVGQRRAMIFMVKFNILKNVENFLQNVPRYKDYDNEKNPLPPLMLVFNPEDNEYCVGTKCVSEPLQNPDFVSWLGCPFLSHFEMNQYYLGDGCQAYIGALGNFGLGISTYSENPFFPEGVWDINQFRLRNTDFSKFPLDLRELPDFTISNNARVRLITSERPAETDALLRPYGLRNIPQGSQR